MSQPTEADIFKNTREKENISQSQMARDLDIPRQRLFAYEHGHYSPPTEFLANRFRYSDIEYVREMALEILVRRPELERPCFCLEFIGDNGPCPRHAAVLVKEEK